MNYVKHIDWSNGGKYEVDKGSMVPGLVLCIGFVLLGLVAWGMYVGWFY